MKALSRENFKIVEKYRFSLTLATLPLMVLQGMLLSWISGFLPEFFHLNFFQGLMFAVGRALWNQLISIMLVIGKGVKFDDDND